MRAALQASVSPEIQGRVFTTLGSLETATIPVGLLVAGPVADLIGIQTMYLIGGAIVFLVGSIAFFIPAVKNFEDQTLQPDLAKIA